MARWLCKQEPDCYSFTDLQKDGSTLWDGVTNALAQKHLRAMKMGDKVFFYHTGDEKAIVGIMVVAAEPQPLADDATGKLVGVKVKASKKLKNPVTLAAIKADQAFAEWELVRNSRLSVMPVSDEIWKKIETMSEG